MYMSNKTESFTGCNAPKAVHVLHSNVDVVNMYTNSPHALQLIFTLFSWSTVEN